MAFENNNGKDPVNRRDVGVIISRNAKMIAVLFILFIWFMVIQALKGFGVIGDFGGFWLSLPPAAIFLIVFAVYKKKHTW